MADGTAPVTPGSGELIDVETLTVGSNTVLRQRMELAGAVASAIAQVLNSAPAGTEYGLVTRPIAPAVSNIQGVQGARNAGTITAANSVVGPYSVSGYNLATVTINGTYAGVTAVFECSDDGGTNYYTVRGKRSDTGGMESGPTTLTNTTRSWQIEVGAWTNFRVRATAWTSGTANIGVTFQTFPIAQNPAVNLDAIGGAGLTAGQKTMANSVPVTIASDQFPLTLTNIGATSGSTPAPRSFQNLSVAISPNFQAAYMSSTAGSFSVPTTASTTTSVAYLFHPSAISALRYEITRIDITIEGPTTASTAGQITTIQLRRITAEAGTPGGTVQTILGVDGADAASGGTFRTGATGAPTRATGVLGTWIVQTVATNVHHYFWWDAEQDNQGKGLVCRASTAEGYEISAVANGTAIGTGGLIVAVTYYWKELS